MDREQIEMLLMSDGEDEPTDLIRDLFELFETESREKLHELEKVCMANAVLDLRKIIHFVAGSAGNLGMARLAVFYRAIEQAIDLGELKYLGNAPEPIRAEFEAGCKAFKAEFNL